MRPSWISISPAIARSNVVLAQPEGPVSAAISRGSSEKPILPRIWRGAPEACGSDKLSTATSSRPESPACDMSLKGLYQEGFDRQHHDDEGNRIGQQQTNVEKLERDADLEANAVRAAHQLDDEHDFPHERQAGAGRRGDVRRKLRQNNMTQAHPRGHAKDLRHLIELAIQGARTLTHGDDRVRQLVQRDGADRRDFVQPDPYISEDDNHQRRQI